VQNVVTITWPSLFQRAAVPRAGNSRVCHVQEGSSEEKHRPSESRPRIYRFQERTRPQPWAGPWDISGSWPQADEPLFTPHIPPGLPLMTATIQRARSCVPAGACSTSLVPTTGRSKGRRPFGACVLTMTRPVKRSGLSGAVPRRRAKRNRPTESGTWLAPLMLVAFRKTGTQPQEIGTSKSNPSRRKEVVSGWCGWIRRSGSRMAYGKSNRFHYSGFFRDLQALG
jgi:hypothetical protein